MSPEGYATWCLGVIRRDIEDDRIPLYINFSGRTELGELQEHIVSALRGHTKYENDKLKEELGDVAFFLYAACALRSSPLDENWDTSGKIIKRPGVARIINTLCLLNEANNCIERVTEAFKVDARPETHIQHMERLCVCLGWSLPDVIFINRVKLVRRSVEGSLIDKEKRLK